MEVRAALPLRVVLCIVPSTLEVSLPFRGLPEARWSRGCGAGLLRQPLGRVEMHPGLWRGWGLAKLVSGNTVHFQFLPFSLYPACV